MPAFIWIERVANEEELRIGIREIAAKKNCRTGKWYGCCDIQVINQDYNVSDTDCMKSFCSTQTMMYIFL